MAGLPKIALARLKANPGAPAPSGPSLGPGVGAGHPDANLLAAFAEKTLTERERTQVLNHLAHCAECREITAFALPVEAVGAEPARVVAGRRSTPWPILRWGATAAVLGTLAVIVTLHPGMWNKRLEISKETPPSAPAGNITSALPTVPAPPSAQPPPERTRAKAKVEELKSAGATLATKKAPEPEQDQALDNQFASVHAKRQVAIIASSRPPADVRGTNIPVAGGEREEMRRANEHTAGAALAPSLLSAPAAEPLAVSEEAGKVSTQSQARVQALHATTSSGAVARAKGGTSTAEVATAKGASRTTTYPMMAQARMGALQAPPKIIEIAAAPPAAVWNVSPEGKVQRSTDAGKSWEPVRVADGIKFRAIAALGNNIWTGGSGGALYHSIDGGATWARVDINFEGNAVTETITGIQSSDPQHLTITTASGSQWVSEDGGQHWQKQP